ncbi:MAG TPA: flagellar protein FlaG [Candidatus Wunengus sp. YC60]|uniref:flagellar protein FlaG n=1 Tax=Candidatus Wunengus sp. YC60 TaxID=3367697 RepID=UPI0040260432
METHTIQSVNTYNIHNEHDNNPLTKKSLITGEILASNKAKNSKDTKKAQPSNTATPSVSTHITYSVESDLNLVVTRTVDTHTNKVLRQVPSEEVIRKMKLSKTYRPPQSIAKGLLLNNVVE